MSWYDDILGRASAKSTLIAPEDALPGREQKMPVPTAHYVNGHPLTPPFPAELQTLSLIHIYAADDIALV